MVVQIVVDHVIKDGIVLKLKLVLREYHLNNRHHHQQHKVNHSYKIS